MAMGIENEKRRHGDTVVMPDNRIAWECRLVDGQKRHGIADDMESAEHCIRSAYFWSVVINSEFSPPGPPSRVPPPSSDGGPPLIITGPGGDYRREYSGDDILKECKAPRPRYVRWLARTIKVTARIIINSSRRRRL